MTVRDLENDGSSDIIWWGPNGEFGYWNMLNGIASFKLIGPVSRSDFTFLGVGDFNQNGGKDIFWYGRSVVANTPGAGNTFTQSWQDLIGYWSMDANGGVVFWDAVQVNGVTITGTTGQPATNVQTGNFLKVYYTDRQDFTGEGRADYITEVNGNYTIQTLNDAARPVATQTFAPGAAWRIAGLNDFNADGRSDIFWRNSTTNECGIYLVKNGIVDSWTSFGFISQDWVVAATGALGGDSKASIVWRNINTNQYGAWLMRESGTTVTPEWQAIGYVDPSWQIRQVGDFWGDGTDDILWRSTTSGAVQGWNYENGSLVGSAIFGTVPTNWDIVRSGPEGQ